MKTKKGRVVNRKAKFSNATVINITINGTGDELRMCKIAELMRKMSNAR